MSHAQLNPAESSQQQAAVEFQQLIQERYPDTVFAVGSGGDDPDLSYISYMCDSYEVTERLASYHVLCQRSSSDSLTRLLVGTDHAYVTFRFVVGRAR